MDSYTVAENTNSYTVTGLSDNDNYNVTITAVGVCGMITSDPVTVYGECVCNSYVSYNLQCQFTCDYGSTHTYTCLFARINFILVHSLN